MFMLGLLGLKQVLVLKQVAILYSQFSVGRVLADKNCLSITVIRISIKQPAFFEWPCACPLNRVPEFFHSPF